jgi:uridine phosphorylase
MLLCENANQEIVQNVRNALWMLLAMEACAGVATSVSHYCVPARMVINVIGNVCQNYAGDTRDTRESSATRAELCSPDKMQNQRKIEGKKKNSAP